MKKILILLIVGLSIACSATWGSQNTPNSRKTASSYRIKKIIDEETFFIIYAVRNDSTFKIVSDAVEDGTTDFDGEKIRVGKSYHLDLDKFFPTVPGSCESAFIWRNKDIWGEKKSHYSLYNALNLNGLYLKKD